MEEIMATSHYNDKLRRFLDAMRRGTDNDGCKRMTTQKETDKARRIEERRGGVRKVVSDRCEWRRCCEFCHSAQRQGQGRGILCKEDVINTVNNLLPLIIRDLSLRYLCFISSKKAKRHGIFLHHFSVILRSTVNDLKD